MKLLLTSAGIKNASIHKALVDLLGKPIADSNALCIPTAGYGNPYGSPAGPWRFISGRSAEPMCELGWKSLGVPVPRSGDTEGVGVGDRFAQ
jgi:dipeptidase E